MSVVHIAFVLATYMFVHLRALLVTTNEVSGEVLIFLWKWIESREPGDI